MADGWATFGKGVFVALAVAGGVWIGRGGQLPVLQVPGGAGPSPVGYVAGNHSSPAGMSRQAGRVREEPSSQLSPDQSAVTLPETLTAQTANGERLALLSPSSSGTSLLVITSAANAATAQAAPQVKTLVANDTSYGPSEGWIRSGSEFRVVLSDPPGNNRKIIARSAGSDDLPGTINGNSSKIWTFQTPNVPTKESYSFQLFSAAPDGSDASGLSSPFLIRVAGENNRISTTGWLNNRFATSPRQLQSAAILAPAGYLRIKGRANPGDVVRFTVEQGTSTQFNPVLDDYNAVATGTNGDWEATLHIPSSQFSAAESSGFGRILSYATLGAQRYYSPSAVMFRVTAPVQPAQFSISKVAKTSAEDRDIRLTNEGTIKVFWEHSPDITDAYVVLLDGNAPQAQATAPLPSGSLTWTIPSEGRHNLRLAVVQGDQMALSSNSVTIDFRQHGPRPTGVELVTPQQTARAAVIRVHFEEASPLSAASGSTTVNKNFFELTRDHAPATGESRNVTIASATYIKEQSVVELTVTNGLEADGYTLLVKNTIPKDNGTESLVDIYGNALGAVPELKEGHSFPFTFFKSVGEILPSQSRGLSGVTGENAVYPEYTKPRPQQDGFNPSDKVVTRIARLYYFRDAHRVVQLLNREARSYNRAAVDQQQQLADNALRDAENAGAERRDAEGAAVRAAGRARAAEQALVQAQAALVQAQKDQRDAGNGIDQARIDVRNQTTIRDRKKAAADEAATKLKAVRDRTDPPADAATIKNAEDAKVTADGELRASETTLIGVQDQLDELVRLRDQVATRLENATRLVNTSLGEVQTSRSTEITESDKSVQAAAKEDQAQKTLFRREVAAATADPDTYARGNPESVDPLLQVSYSVIGEGEIQLRGPIKGVNLARTLINQIDSPVGQVRVAIHTVQVNGERGERMEPVVERIGRYVDQSRFLTSQSGQMLRNAVTMVAARKAEEAFVECEGFVEADHQVKYLEAFFGKQFINELREMDSEFLRADNKLLSLHSMDSTSLAQALFLLALAKNDVRQEILCEFDRLTTCDLPLAETEYFGASGAAWKFGPPFHKQKYQFLGHNARFVSLRGQFNVQVTDPDTITPMQREFIRLAQIFKSRLVAEREIQQRVMERGLIEDRFEDYAASQRNARDKETQVKLSQQAVVESVQESQSAVVKLAAEFAILESTAYSLINVSERAVQSIQRDSNAAYSVRVAVRDPACKDDTSDYATRVLDSDDELLKFLKSQVDDCDPVKEFAAKFVKCGRLKELWERREEQLQGLTNNVGEITRMSVPTGQAEAPKSRRPQIDASLKSLKELKKSDIDFLMEQVRSIHPFPEMLQRLVYATSRQPLDAYAVLREWLVIREQIRQTLKPDSNGQILAMNSAIAGLIANVSRLDLADGNVERARHPLDYKKFMDMLVDDAEDKYIEILEGTRAHTANIDNYLGRIITSLDDDFNSQFYNPTFKHIREAGRYWDVQMGQIETTTVLTNNRTFAKVSPQAQMEFDLPKRDILISEAFESAAAAYQDYGALLQDPTFLSLTKMYRGQPPSATYGSALPTPMVRDVLPGLPSATNEKMMIQQGTTSPDFPSALESLIPDPAIYKFETGTGFEVRPVIQPDGQAVTFHLNYMYTTNVREPVRADEKHLGRIKRHFVDTDVTLGNFEMREVSKYTVALKASRTARGVPLLEDVPVAGILFRPLPQQQSSLQQNVILSQATIFPTLFDLMGLRWAPAIADLGTGNLKELDFVTKNRRKDLQNRVFDYSSGKVDEFLQIAPADRRRDLYRPQDVIEQYHPNGTTGPGMNLKELEMDDEGPAIQELQQPTDPTMPEAPPARFMAPSAIGAPQLGGLPVIQQQSYQVPAKDAWKSAKPQRLPQVTPAAPRKPVARPAEPKRLPTQDKPGSVRMLGPQSSRTKLSAASPIVLTSATRAGDAAPVKLLDRSEDDLFAAPEIRPVSELRSEPRDDAAAKDSGKRRWFKIPFLSRSK